MLWRTCVPCFHSSFVLRFFLWVVRFGAVKWNSLLSCRKSANDGASLTSLFSLEIQAAPPPRETKTKKKRKRFVLGNYKLNIQLPIESWSTRKWNWNIIAICLQNKNSLCDANCSNLTSHETIDNQSKRDNDVFRTAACEFEEICSFPAGSIVLAVTFFFF